MINTMKQGFVLELIMSCSKSKPTDVKYYLVLVKVLLYVTGFSLALSILLYIILFPYQRLREMQIKNLTDANKFNHAELAEEGACLFILNPLSFFWEKSIIF